MPPEDKPVLTKAPTTELEGVEPVERPIMEPYVAKKGWVKDPQGRFHEVDDQARFLESYPGSEAVKESQVTKAKVGYADAAEAPVTAPATAGGAQSEG